MAVAVVTRGYDNARTGANTHEEVLTAQVVATRGIRRLFSLRLTGDARGVEAQPLVVPGVRLPDGASRDVIYLATMANQLWAFAAADGTLLWKTTLGTPVNGSRAIDAHLINDHWGVLSTPVVDLASQTMYVVAWVSPDGTVAAAEHVIHAVRLSDGKPVHPPLSLENAVYDPGHGLPVQRFKSAARKQRASLLLTSVAGVTTVFVGFGSVQETSATSRGWVIACGTAPFAVTTAWASTVRGHGGGIWQAGAGLAADKQGFVYAMTGNGAFDGVTDFGESFIKLRYSPPRGHTQASFTLVDWWTPWTDAQRTAGAAPAVARDLPTASNFRVYAANPGDGWDDMDLGSGGPLLIESLGLVIGAGKDGILYVLDAANMGKTSGKDLQHPPANYAKLKAPPIFYTYYPPGLDPAPKDVRTLNLLWADRTHHMHGSSVYWNSPELGPALYCWGENGNLRAWSVTATGAVKYLACSAEQASAQSQVPPGGMPGGMLTLSASRNQPHSGVVWACIPYFDANISVGPGRLLAYDATRFGTYPDGSKQLRVLWDSQDWNLTFTFNKFNLPVAANGRLIVPTYNGTVDVYG
jgi:outer membrane protein assembly factor BamB